ncbi:MAG: triose-phosphate isomerase [Oscillospiraceae bacterium]|nr:triose-phosphate isomerase [Oscillospiraceae bacterium]
MRKKFIVGNMKMNKLPSEIGPYIERLKPLVKDAEGDVVLCVPSTNIQNAVLHTKGTNIKVGAQNMYWKAQGAFTGAVSPLMIKDLGAEYVLVGHSERRQLFIETDWSVNKKVAAALEYGLTPIVCIGENLEQRAHNRIEEVIIVQLSLALRDIPKHDIHKIIIAYEPLWAIGTGQTPKKEEVNEIIGWVREKIRTSYGEKIAEEMIIQYGGSVNATNSKRFFNMPEIDGGLVGGACLEPEEFAKIINYND